MGNNKSKIIGTTFEREVVNLAKAYGLESKRAWGSNGNACGWHKDVDLMIETYKFQAKKRNKLAEFLLPSEHVDGVVFKQNRGQSLLMFPLEGFLEILKKEKKNLVLHSIPQAGTQGDEFSIKFPKEQLLKKIKDLTDELSGLFSKDEDNENTKG